MYASPFSFGNEAVRRVLRYSGTVREILDSSQNRGGRPTALPLRDNGRVSGERHQRSIERHLAVRLPDWNPPLAPYRDAAKSRDSVAARATKSGTIQRQSDAATLGGVDAVRNADGLPIGSTMETRDAA